MDIFAKEQEKLTVGVKGIIEENMIKRLTDESNHGEMLVSHALGYLAASRQGLAEDELVDLLSRDRRFMSGSSARPTTCHQTWSIWRWIT